MKAAFQSSSHLKYSEQDDALKPVTLVKFRLSTVICLQANDTLEKKRGNQILIRFRSRVDIHLPLFGVYGFCMDWAQQILYSSQLNRVGI